MKFSHYITVISALPVIVALQASNAFAEEEAGVTFIPSIAYQQKHMKFEQSLRYINTGTLYGTDADFEVDLPTGNLSLTTSYKRMFVTLKYEKSLTDGTTDVDETLQPTEGVYYFNGPGGVTNIDREDMNLTIGYNLFRNFNVFMGYMQGRTEISPEKNCQWDVNLGGSCWLNLPINQGGDAIINLAMVHNALPANTNSYQQTYTEKGPYIGVSYAFQIAEAGTLSFSAAYADMDGTYEDNFALSVAPNVNFKYTGDSTGTSYGITWTGPLGENSNYFFDLRQQKYEMDAEDDNNNFPGGTASTTETMQGVTAGVQLYY